MNDSALDTFVDAGNELDMAARPYYLMALASFDSMDPDFLAHVALELGLTDLQAELDDGAQAFGEWFSLIERCGQPEVDSTLRECELRMDVCDGGRHADKVIKLLTNLGRAQAGKLH